MIILSILIIDILVSPQNIESISLGIDCIMGRYVFMIKRSILAIWIVLLVLSICTPVATSGSVYEDSRKPIPDNLPWYPLVVFGDNRPDPEENVKLPSVYYDIIEEARVINPFAVIGTGDHTGKGTKRQIDELAKSLKDLENVWMALGNHDLWEGNIRYWETVIAPEYYYVDDIPGWRIAFVNSDADTRSLSKQLDTVLNTSSRFVILVIHRPLYPDVGHNIRYSKKQLVENYIREKPNVKLVLQGHWHGYAVGARGGVEYIITGGAGAPLYNWPTTIPGAKDVIKMKYHYLILILYPDGSYEYYPVSVSGEVVVRDLNETARIILNNKTDPRGNPVEIPIRVRYVVNGREYYVVVMANYGSTIINYKVVGNMVLFYTNSSKWYVYSPTSDPEKAIVYLDNEMLELWMNTSKTGSTTYSPESTATTQSPQWVSDYMALAIAGVVVILVIAIALVIMFKRRT